MTTFLLLKNSVLLLVSLGCTTLKRQKNYAELRLTNSKDWQDCRSHVKVIKKHCSKPYERPWCPKQYAEMPIRLRISSDLVQKTLSCIVSVTLQHSYASYIYQETPQNTPNISSEPWTQIKTNE